jgi:hypothetical protein
MAPKAISSAGYYGALFTKMKTGVASRSQTLALCSETPPSPTALPAAPFTSYVVCPTTHSSSSIANSFTKKLVSQAARWRPRIAAAADDATYLLAKVEIIATYSLAHINRARLEALFHRVFAPAQLDLTITDRFGKPVHPQEWFLVPLHVIDEAVNRIRDGSIADFVYDPTSASLIRV